MIEQDEEFKPPVVSGSPEAIWLNYGEIDEDCTHDEAHAHEDAITWCDTKIDWADVKYVRSDLSDQLQSEKLEMARRIEELEKQASIQKIFDNSSRKLLDKFQSDIRELEKAALKPTTPNERPDGYMNPVIRAFWRRIYSYRNDFQKELPEVMPLPFLCSMQTAMLALRDYWLVQAQWCLACNGSGEGKVMEGSGEDAYEIDGPCYLCNGTGEPSQPIAHPNQSIGEQSDQHG